VFSAMVGPSVWSSSRIRAALAARFAFALTVDHHRFDGLGAVGADHRRARVGGSAGPGRQNDAGVLPAGDCELREPSELFAADGRREVRHPEVVAELVVLVRPFPSSVVDEPSDALGDVVAVGRDHSPLARRHVLRGIKGEAGGVGERADGLSLEPRGVCLRRVLDQQQVVCVRDVAEVVHLCGQSVQVDGEDRLDVVLVLPDRLLDAVWVEVERLRVDVGEDRDPAGEPDGVRRRDERERCRHDAISGFDVRTFQRRVERSGSVGRCDPLFGSTVLGELHLERTNDVAVRQLPGFEHVDDARYFGRSDRWLCNGDVSHPFSTPGPRSPARCETRHATRAAGVPSRSSRGWRGRFHRSVGCSDGDMVAWVSPH